MSYFIWLILGVIAFVLEMMMPTFFALFAGIGFIAAGVVAYFQPESLFVQLIAASIFMFVGIIVFRKKRIADSAAMQVGTHNEFVGIQGVATTSLSTRNEGGVELLEPVLGTRSWLAISIDGNIPIGSEIKIVQLKGNTLVVEKK
ncbi:NfeD family protein [bacterium]|nr:NfeD family protein [bacterium]MBU1884886.1 NfeD family protein [bacterium]